MKIFYFISLFFINGIIFGDEIIEKFNKSIDFYEKKDLVNSIGELNSINNLPPKEKEKLGIGIYNYQLGTLYCIDKKYEQCLKELKLSLKEEPDNERIKKNLEIALEKSGSGNNQNNNNNQNQKKKEEEKKKELPKELKAHSASISHIEKRVFRLEFNKNIKKKTFDKDW